MTISTKQTTPAEFPLYGVNMDSSSSMLSFQRKERGGVVNILKENNTMKRKL